MMYAAALRALEAATEPSRELDAAVWLACFEPTCDSLEVEFHTEQYDNFVSRTGIDRPTRSAQEKSSEVSDRE